MKRLGVALTVLLSVYGVALSAPMQKSFESIDDAVNALIGAFRAVDQKALVDMLGPKGRPLVESGDSVADRQAIQRFVADYDRAHRVEGGGGKVTLYTGEDDFPFPIPLVPAGPRWIWDTDAGDDEILFRRVGRNELAAIKVCLAFVDAQREYYVHDHTGSGVLEFAQRFESTKGKQDGLYWETRPGDRPSPLGPLVAKARAEGYRRSASGEPIPYHGYFYRPLLAQGPAAPGGAYDYVVKGHMIGGFALVAFPAKYAVSGIMSFLVSHDGVVYQKDLGPNTTRIAEAMKTYNPDRTWKQAEPDASKR
jgi:hypothetical protein